MKYKEKWKIVYKSHAGEWDQFSFYDYATCRGFKEKLINAYTCSEIKIYHYELTGRNIGQPRCVFDAVGLVSYDQAVEDVERMSPHMF